MIVDAHLHCFGNERARDILCSLDEAMVDIAVLLAPFLTHPYSLACPESLRTANAHLVALVNNHPDRLIGFVVVNSLNPCAFNDLQQAVERLALRGLKFDISFGPPPVHRAETLKSALTVLGPHLLQFGSDWFLPCGGDHIRMAIDEVIRLFNGLGNDPASRQRIMGDMAAKWLGLSAN